MKIPTGRCFEGISQNGPPLPGILFFWNIFGSLAWYALQADLSSEREARCVFGKGLEERQRE